MWISRVEEPDIEPALRCCRVRKLFDKAIFLKQKKIVVTKNQDIKKLNMVAVFPLGWTIFGVEREAEFLKS